MSHDRTFYWSPGIECFHCGCDISSSRQKFYCEECKTRVFQERKNASAVVHKMIKDKEIPNASELPCEDCGGLSEHYDHRDYAKPCEVSAVCRRCNFSRGPCRIDGFTRQDVPVGWTGSFAKEWGDTITTTVAMQALGVVRRNDLADLLGYGTFWDICSGNSELKPEPLLRAKILIHDTPKAGYLARRHE